MKTIWVAYWLRGTPPGFTDVGCMIYGYRHRAEEQFEILLRNALDPNKRTHSAVIFPLIIPMDLDNGAQYDYVYKYLEKGSWPHLGSIL